jgi:hypothetical protein
MRVAIDAAPDGAPVILHGADAIGAFLFPNEPPARRKRRVYHLTSEVPKADRLPTFKLGAVVCARPSTLLAWIAEREGRRAIDPMQPKRDGPRRGGTHR